MKRQDGRRVRFIRKNGRIIPIHVREGVSQYAAGTAIGVGGGALAAALERAPQSARKFTNNIMWAGVREAKRQAGAAARLDARQLAFGHLGEAATKSAQALSRNAVARYKATLGIRKLASYGPKAAIPVFLVSSALAGAYFAAGTQNLTKSKRGDVKKSLASDVVAGAGFVATGAGYFRGMGTPWGKAIARTISFLPDFMKKKGNPFRG